MMQYFYSNQEYIHQNDFQNNTKMDFSFAKSLHGNIFD